MPYLTPDSAPGTTVCRTIVIPDDPLWIAIVNGALSELFKSHNFEQFGSLTPQQTADAFRLMWQDFHASRCTVIPIGMIAAFSFPSAALEVGWFLCNGQAISRTTYADLFALIGTHYGVGDGTTTFTLPDLRAMFIRQGADDNWYVPDGVAAAGGEASHVLTIPELPAHHHTVSHSNAAGTSVNFAPGAATNLTNQNTSDVGSGSAHNNLPPFLNLAYCIFAGG